MSFRLVPFAHALVAFSEAVPACVASSLSAHTASICGKCGIEFFVREEFMTHQCPGVAEALVQLCGALEACNSLLMFSAEGEGIADDAPSLRRVEVEVSQGVR